MLHQFVLLLLLLYSLMGLIISWYQTQVKQNFFGLCHFLNPLGAFVWTDGIILGLFWVGLSLMLLFLNNPMYSLLTYSLFWTVRSSGEIIYWLLEQFATTKRNPPATLLPYLLFPNESVWIVMQLGWQCTLLLSLLVDIISIRVLFSR